MRKKRHLVFAKNLRTALVVAVLMPSFASAAVTNGCMRGIEEEDLWFNDPYHGKNLGDLPSIGCDADPLDECDWLMGTVTELWEYEDAHTYWDNGAVSVHQEVGECYIR